MPESPTAGTLLAQARRQAKASVADVSAATRIRGGIIEALEHDDVGPSGGMAYARGHMRSIAVFLGTDPDPILAVLDPRPVVTTERTPPRVEPRSLGSAMLTTAGAGSSVRGPTPNWSAVMAGALALIVAFGLFQVIRVSGDSAPGVAAPSRTSVSPPATSPTTPLTTPTSPPPSTDEPVAQADGVRVVVEVPGTVSWVVASTASGTLFEGLMNNGDRRVFKDDKRVRLLLGNAGAVGLTVNGVDLGAPGGSGQVTRLSFGPGNPNRG